MSDAMCRPAISVEEARREIFRGVSCSTSELASAYARTPAILTRLVASETERADKAERAFAEYLERGDCPAKPFLVPGTDDGVSAQYVMVLTTPAIALVEDLNAKLEKANFDRK